MNILSFHKELLDNYRSYINSFIHIKCPEIKTFVEAGMDDKKLWLEPLIQFNPTFEKGKALKSLVDAGQLHPELSNIFSDIDLYRHQEEAILLGADGREFVVTSGTGSGKSLTYMATIFDHVLKQGERAKGKIQAVIVYPMNALINSQYKEIEKFKEKYEQKHGKDFPITFGQYTGQENEIERERMRNDPPHIFLTNYVMLEYLMTRGGDDVKIRRNILDSLRFLVFDELHTYRGRQGADVSILIRRIKAQAKNPVTCIGTSATMVSGENSTIQQQREEVAKTAGIIFGTSLTWNQVVNEYLVRSLDGDYRPSIGELVNAIKDGIDQSKNHQELEKHPTANWLEENIALEPKAGQYVRRKPTTIKDISAQLQEATGLTLAQCELHIAELLSWANKLNANKPANIRKNYLPYKIHQFISQTGTVYATLGAEDSRDFQLEAGLYAEKDNSFLFPLVFSRESGHEFYCVTLDDDESRILPMEFYNMGDEEDEDNLEEGYIFIQHKEDAEIIWDPDRDIPELPDSWFNPKRKDGTRSLKKNYQTRIPRKIYFDRQGQYSFDQPLQFEGWFISKPLALDPTSGVIYSDRNEWRKLARLGGEGRSTATTVLSFETISLLHKFQQPSEKQKLLSFTDNRQDASLQSGHFNDFVKVGQLRAAINQAIQTYHSLDYASIKEKVFECLNIPQEEYAKNPASFPGPKKENEDAFKDYIMYKILHDLRRSWRVVLPNLEQCALLRINYKYLSETVKDNALWKASPLFSAMDPATREEFIFQILEYFRKAYALSFSLLEQGTINKNSNTIKEKLKRPWTLDDSDRIEYANVIRIEKLRTSDAMFSQSASYSGAFGRYLRNMAGEHGLTIQGKDAYATFAYSVFDYLVDGGWLISKPATTEENRPAKVYQLKVDNILWEQGDKESTSDDLIRKRAYRDQKSKVNKYFQRFYSVNRQEMKSIEGAEHTGQINSEKRKEREQLFREGNLSALFCSPTMELGIDISDLSIVHMRNVPPSPANYAQRSGRAGRSGQAALVMVYCSNFNPHDRYYFKNASKMVSGSVSTPRLDLINQELLSSHLNGMILTRRSLNSLKNSLGDLVDKDDANNLPLRPEIVEALTLSEEDKRQITADFQKVVSDTYFTGELADRNPFWYNENWIKQQIDDFLANFDRSLTRWRDLYRSAMNQLRAANAIIENKIYGENHEKVQEAKRSWRQAERQTDLLLNRSSGRTATSSGKNDQSEFYPYRYLAAEGFLPGYNFTRLPLRAFLENDESGGEFVTRARYMALSEFGPRNIIYHDGSQYRVDRIILPDAEAKLERAKISPYTGYIMMKDQFNYQVDPIVNLELNSGMDEYTHMNFVEMPEARAYELQRITCQEEERTRKGFQIQTFFTLDSGFENTTEAQVNLADQKLLHVHSLPSARLVHVNFKWRASHESGYALHLKNGYWQTKAQEEDESRQDDIKKVKLYTTTTANSLYIQPVTTLGLEGGHAGVITLMFALKRAIENVFQVESNEIGVAAIGQEENPNILIYEASEGSLGVLSQFVEKPEYYRAVMQEAYDICFKKNGVEIPDGELQPASYEDLLSYYNQFYHREIDKRLIKNALVNLQQSAVEILDNRTFKSYDDQYRQLEAKRDQYSASEKAFLQYLKKNSLRLPDSAQPNISNMFVRPDFMYHPNVMIFCDGTPHDDPSVKLEDEKKRKALKASGYQVLSWYYKDSLDEFVSKRPDIFKKVKSDGGDIESIDSLFQEATQKFDNTLKKLGE